MLAMASEEELKRRAEEARIRAILEPTDDETRSKLRRRQRQEQERQAAEAERARTGRLATLLMIAVIATAAFGLIRWFLAD